VKLSCKKHRKLSIMQAYGELPDKERGWFEAHLLKCHECRAANEGIRETLGTMSAHQVPEFDKAFPERQWSALYAQLQERNGSAPRVPKRAGWWDTFTPAYRLAMAAGVALLLFVSGLVIGRFFLGGGDPPPGGGQATLAPGPEEDLIASPAEQASQYLDRSKVLILGLMNNRPAGGVAFEASLQRQQQVSRELLAQAQLLQAELRDPGQVRLRALVAQLEYILQQIASMDAKQGLSGVEILKSDLDQEAILFKINLEQMALDEMKHSSGQGVENKGS
jgi:hypothetical protein